ncbi:hypothetical protein LLEC1_06229 [Akanthomyces lecanii]|uniref:Glutathione S-transferase C-terminal domain-containing protein n=1 Tax=Cordyceps confragosa TaxID=2714763 RepID=A0A179IAP8_CORDF|nr:hypothetical protein LLEC1_06229 [Akanthomyces lecanii]
MPAIDYLAKFEPGHLLGDGSLEQGVEDMSWVNWANQEMLMIMSKWCEFLFWTSLSRFCRSSGLARPAPCDKAAAEAGKAATLALLDESEAAIKDSKFLVGESFTIADIFVISRGLE